MNSDVELLVKEIEAARDRVAPLVPDIDPADLLSILQCLLSPPGAGRRFFIREIAPNVFAF
ncbi:MAG TPA: hypothetical protein VKN99_03065 [Polyangia bacterium]|nr:hypothetical protein [Polyangia bacterium]